MNRRLFASDTIARTAECNPKRQRGALMRIVNEALPGLRFGLVSLLPYSPLES